MSFCDILAVGLAFGGFGFILGVTLCIVVSILWERRPQ